MRLDIYHNGNLRIACECVGEGPLPPGWPGCPSGRKTGEEGNAWEKPRPSEWGELHSTSEKGGQANTLTSQHFGHMAPDRGRPVLAGKVRS